MLMSVLVVQGSLSKECHQGSPSDKGRALPAKFHLSSTDWQNAIALAGKVLS